MIKKTPLTVIIPCCNEEANIKFAIESFVDWVDDLIILDSGSTDATLDIARKYPVRIVEHAWEGYAKQWNWALENIEFKHEWLLMAAADMTAANNVREAVFNAIQNEEFDAYHMRTRYIFLDKWIKHASGYPQWILYLFKHKQVRYEERQANEHPIVKGKTGYLKADMVHHDRKSLWHYLDRHNKYSDFEAEERYKAWYGKTDACGELKAKLFGRPAERRRFLKNRIWKWIPFKSLTRFVHLYFFKLGFLDGMPGLYFCLHKAAQEMYTNMKIRELRAKSKKNISGN